MHADRYQLKSGRSEFKYEFVSIGPKGLIPKRIQFILIDPEPVYNLAFGDAKALADDFDDLTTSNNGDSEKVLVTVADSVYDFLEANPNAWVFITGSTPARTRLYQMGIARYLNELENVFEIFGQLHDEWHHFEKNGNYKAFLVRTRKTKFDI